MHKKTAIVSFTLGFTVGAVATVGGAFIKLIRGMKASGMDTSDPKSALAELQKTMVGIQGLQELFLMVQEEHPEMLDDPRFQKYNDRVDFIDITKNL